MSSPQRAIFQEQSSCFYYLEYSIRSDVTAAELKTALKQVLATQLEAVELVVAFGDSCWRMLSSWSPQDLVPFTAMQGSGGYAVPTTQRDLFFWIHSENHDDNFDQVLQLQKVLADVATLELDQPGFRYHDSRDLIGFVDGTANPKEDARQQAALIPEGELGAGGSYILTQKWVHNLGAFNHLPIAEQEKVVGRTKVDSIELEGDDMPADSHVSRTDVKLNGKAMKIYRRSAPYGSATEHGLYFLAFACEIERFSIQLERMFGMTEDGLHDKLIEFSTPVTSSYWFAPCAEDLQAAITG